MKAPLKQPCKTNTNTGKQGTKNKLEMFISMKKSSTTVYWQIPKVPAKFKGNKTSGSYYMQPLARRCPWIIISITCEKG